MNLWNLSGLALAVTGCILGLALIVYLNDKDKENVLGNYLVGIGCVLLIAASQRESLDNQAEQTNPDKTDKSNKPDQAAEQIKQLTERITQLELQLK
ncbi:MAG: hypothetical protein E6713_03825 [Sporomusaceae bacterium]|nr:hypothetical protein [Sporomusaceae bacterium]